MHLFVAGLNHRTAPVDLREKVAIAHRRLGDALTSLTAREGVLESVILSTCNRTEIYASLESPISHSGEELLTEFLAALSATSASHFSGHIYHYRDERAVEHLMKVSTGLDSMILGENQILGQVKTAYEVAWEAGATGVMLNTLFQSAISVGKRARTETAIGVGAFSVGAAAVELATRIFGDTLAGRTVLILGAGKMSELTARHLQARGAPAVLVTNRSYDRAVQLARQLENDATARRFDEMPDALMESDIVICSTAAPHPIVDCNLIQTAMRARKNRPLFLIDIAVPRDVDPEVGDMNNVYLYNIDDLSAVVARDQYKRQAEVGKAQAIIDAAVLQYQEWRRSLEVVPLVTAVRERLDSLRLEELARLRARLPHLGERDLRVIETALQSIIGKVAHDATTAIKESSLSADSAGYDRLDAIRGAFGLNVKIDLDGNISPSEKAVVASPAVPEVRDAQQTDLVHKAVERA